MARIATYVFLDVETTILLQKEQNKKRITKLCMFVVKRDHILGTIPGDLPRVQPKLTLCFNPSRMVEPGGTRALGLEYELKFDINAFNAINSFLKCQQKPICLISKNGHRFNFPILKNHFEEISVSLADDVMCADTLRAFNSILKLENLDETITCQLDETNKTAIVNVPVQETDNLSNVKMEAGDLDPDSQISFQKLNEMTPKKSIKPKNFKGIKEVRKIFVQKDGEPKESYDLKDIYEQILRRPAIDAHTLEKDCMMSVEICVAKAEQFVEWIDANHCPFSEVKAWRKRLGVQIDF